MISVLDNPILSPLFGDETISGHWDARAQLGHYLAFEAALAEALDHSGVIPQGSGIEAAAAIRTAEVPLEALGAGTAHDGVPIPALVRVLRERSSHPKAVHTGATSQDVMDTALVMTLREVTTTLLDRLDRLSEVLRSVTDHFGNIALMGRTRMQAALPITVDHRTESWRAPLLEHHARLTGLRDTVEVLQLGGPVGTRGDWGDAAEAISQSVAASLSLRPSPRAWHSNRTALAEYAGALSLLTGSMGKMGQDICLMSQQGIDEIRLSGGGGSSAMPHKSNPVLAELLVTLARFNASQLASMHHSLIHEQERSGSAWMLEWMTLPAMTLAAGRSLSAGIALVEQIERIGTPKAG